MANLHTYLTSFYEDDKNFEIWDIVHEMNFKSLPQVKEEYGGKEYIENIDFENHEIVEINLDTNTMVIACGGDWQDPLEFSVTLKDDTRFHYNNDAIPVAKWKDGMTNEEVKKLLKIK